MAHGGLSENSEGLCRWRGGWRGGCAATIAEKHAATRHSRNDSLVKSAGSTHRGPWSNQPTTATQHHRVRRLLRCQGATRSSLPVHRTNPDRRGHWPLEDATSATVLPAELSGGCRPWCWRRLAWDTCEDSAACEASCRRPESRGATPRAACGNEPN